MAVSTNVTVLGAGGSTVTVPFNSAANAAAAQSALNIINTAIQVGLLNQVNYTGAGSIASPAGTLFPLTGAIASGTVTGNAGALPFGTVDFVTNSTNKVTVVGPTNVITVASGAGGITFGNQSAAAKMFIGGGNSTYIGFANSGAEIGVDGTGNMVWDYGSKSAVTVKGYDQSATFFARGSADTLGANTFGSVSVIAQAGTSTYLQSLAIGVTSPSSAMTISGAAGANISYFGNASTSAFINPTSGNVTISGQGAVTLAGGGFAPSFTGSATVFGGTGVFFGGKAGKNFMQTSTLAGVTTLTGGGDGDILFNQGAKNLLVSAQTGSSTLVGAQSTTIGGALFQTGGGLTTVFGNAGGGNSFFLGNGTTNIIGSGVDTLGAAVTTGGVHANANLYSTIAPGGIALISDFISGFDKFSLTNSNGTPTLSNITFYTAGQGGSPFTGANSGTLVQLSDNTKLYFYNSQVKNSDFS